MTVQLRGNNVRREWNWRDQFKRLRKSNQWDLLINCSGWQTDGRDKNDNKIKVERLRR